MTDEWQRGDRFLELRSKWFTLYGEHWLDHHGQSLDYWRIERAHSVIVLPIQGTDLLLPRPFYRPGIAAMTYDFPGGRLPEGLTPEHAAYHILQRELGLDTRAIATLEPLAIAGWVINSSFSNQQLYGWVAHLHPDSPIAPDVLGLRIPTTTPGIQALLQKLTCLQCRAVLLEWWFNQRAQQDSNL